MNVPSSVKYLGVTIDNKLKFDEHIKFVERKIACTVDIMCKLKAFFPKEMWLQLYHALINPHLLNATPVCMASYKFYTQNLFSLQHKAIRIVIGVRWDAIVNPFYQELKILKLDQVY